MACDLDFPQPFHLSMSNDSVVRLEQLIKSPYRSRLRRHRPVHPDRRPTGVTSSSPSPARVHARAGRSPPSQGVRHGRPAPSAGPQRLPAPQARPGHMALRPGRAHHLRQRLQRQTRRPLRGARHRVAACAGQPEQDPPGSIRRECPDRLHRPQGPPGHRSPLRRSHRPDRDGGREGSSRSAKSSTRAPPAPSRPTGPRRSSRSSTPCRTHRSVPRRWTRSRTRPRRRSGTG